MRRRLIGAGLLIAGILLLAACADIDSPAPRPTTRIDADANPRYTLGYLASPQLEGRGVGLAGLDTAGDFVADEFAAGGLKPLDGRSDFFQSFDYTDSIAPTSGTAFRAGDKSFDLYKDFSPLGLSGQRSFDGEVVFAGYSITAPEANYDDFAGIDVRGKVVLAMRYEPVDKDGLSRMPNVTDPSGYSQHAVLEEKARNAAAHGAAALLLVSPADLWGPDVLLPFASSFAGSTATIPVLHISRQSAEQLLQSGHAPDLRSLRQMVDTPFSPHSIPLPGVHVSGDVQVERVQARLKNVIGCIHGAGPHADEYVVVGAHYDHLGRGRLGHQLGPTGSIYYGADDNASGTALVLDLASRFARRPPPDRTLVFMTFTGEEEGLVGSEYFVKHPLIPLDKIVAMANFDMVGRLRNRTIYLGGEGTARDFDAILAAAGAKTGMTLKSVGRGGLGPSDHMAFAQQHVPVLFFFTGIHADYHRPTDTADKINYSGIDTIADFATEVVDGLARMPKEEYIVEADKDSFRLFGGTGNNDDSDRRALLGIVPDDAIDESRIGVLISGTSPNTPAARAGLQNGDLLVQFGDQKLENLQDLTRALEQANPGDKVVVKFRRGNQTLNVTVTLAERSP